eukprot:6865729-Lingulodinium_polyedra.AAC.1
MEKVEHGAPKRTASTRPEAIHSLYTLRAFSAARSWRGSPTASGALTMSTSWHSHPTALRVAAR